MQQYLLVYNRRRGAIIRHSRFRAAGPALAARFAAEREFRHEPDIEVVVLGADSWESLKHTHARYFKGVQELAKAALRREVRTT